MRWFASALVSAWEAEVDASLDSFSQVEVPPPRPERRPARSSSSSEQDSDLRQYPAGVLDDMLKDARAVIDGQRSPKATTARKADDEKREQKRKRRAIPASAPVHARRPTSPVRDEDNLFSGDFIQNFESPLLRSGFAKKLERAAHGSGEHDIHEVLTAPGVEKSSLATSEEGVRADMKQGFDADDAFGDLADFDVVTDSDGIDSSSFMTGELASPEDFEETSTVATFPGKKTSKKSLAATLREKPTARPPGIPRKPAAKAPRELLDLDLYEDDEPTQRGMVRQIDAEPPVADDFLDEAYDETWVNPKDKKD